MSNILATMYLKYALQAELGLEVVVVVLPDPFRGMVAWRNSSKTQKSGYAPRFEPTPPCFTVVVKFPLLSSFFK